MNWLTFAVLGEGALSPEEYEELKAYGKLPLESLDLVDTSYVLGRMKSFMKAKEYKEVSLAQAKDVRDNSIYTDVERLAIEHARFAAGQHLKGLEDDVTAGIYKRLQVAMGQTVSAESIRSIVRDETANALSARKTYQELASSLAEKTMAAHGRDWVRVSRTEMHRAKVNGITQAIVNKLGPYRGGDGPDSEVIIIPGPKCCEDCEYQYLDANGVPRVFKLSDLLAAGSNGDPGVSHKRNELGVHGHWKTTLPPLHPNCGCVVQYLPPGTAVVDRRGSLIVKSLDLYAEAIVKADGNGVGNPVAKPPGPPQASKVASPPSVSGAKAPGQKIKAKAPSASGGKGASMGGIALRYVPKSSVSKRPAGTIRDTDSSYVVMPGMKQGQAPTEEMKRTMRKDEMQRAIAHAKVKHEHKKTVKALQHAEITTAEPLGADEKGISEAYCATLKDSGRALMKPAQVYSDNVLEGNAWTEGVCTVPHGRGAHHEAGAYQAHMMFGLTEHVPPTAVRMTPDGSPQSMQQWQEGTKDLINSPALKKAREESGINNSIGALLSAVPAEHKEKVRQKLEDHSVMAVVLNHNDAHPGNVMVTEDLSDVRFVDNTATGGTGMSDHKNVVMHSMQANGMKVRISDKLNERFKKTTFQDMQRGMGNHYSDWQVGQSFMRMRYAQALQERDGHLDGEYFKSTMTLHDGQQVDRGSPQIGVGGANSMFNSEFMRRKEAGTTPNQIFESWSKKYINDVAGNPDHPDHHSINAIANVGVFMPGGTASMSDPSKFRQSGGHREYENSIQPRDIPTVAQMKSGRAEAPADAPIAPRKKNAPVAADEDKTKKPGSKPAAPAADEDKTKKPGRKPAVDAHAKTEMKTDEEKTKKQKVDRSEEKTRKGGGLYLSADNVHRRLDSN